MCKATTYQYRCGAAFHTISSCEKQCYAGHSHSPDASSPDTNGGSVKHHDSSTTSLLTSSIGTKAASTKSSFLSNGADNATGFHSRVDSQQQADLDAGANDSSSIFTPLPTPVNPYPRPIHIHRLPSSLAPSRAITPERASSVLRSAQQKQQQQEQHRHNLPHSDAVGHGLKSILPSRWLRNNNNGATAAPEEKNEEVQVIVWQDAPEVRQAGVARGAVAVEGACPACAEREAREAAWAAMATFRGED
ncbi:hypothetical protein DIS24_g7074 [Lasiodiplodia hormozganensis]|uniref:Uncharacterized protein n=1 Tax=Lasiodiplodia hormozganensis TaxID=869390 RepID=A0AA39YCL0_9PEZI|nr:hypothetical protein DIS24_g7074 [Lasiodiplodia hormozganensis]